MESKVTFIWCQYNGKCVFMMCGCQRESRSPHKYSPVLVGRGYRYQAVELGDCSAGHASPINDKGPFCWMECRGVGERGHVAAWWPNSRWMSFGKMSAVPVQLAWCDPQLPVLTAGRVFILEAEQTRAGWKDLGLRNKEHVHTRQREPLVSY